MCVYVRLSKLPPLSPQSSFRKRFALGKNHPRFAFFGFDCTFFGLKFSFFAKSESVSCLHPNLSRPTASKIQLLTIFPLTVQANNPAELTICLALSSNCLLIGPLFLSPTFEPFVCTSLHSVHTCACKICMQEHTLFSRTVTHNTQAAHNVTLR